MYMYMYILYMHTHMVAKHIYRIAPLTPCCKENWVSGHLPLLCRSFWLGCVLLHLAPGCVLRVLFKACVSKLHRETKKEEKTGVQIKAYFLRFLCDSSSTFCCCFVNRKKKKTKHIGVKLVSPLFSTLLFFTFSVDLNFSWADMLCSSPVTPTLLNSSGSNTSRAQPINH